MDRPRPLLLVLTLTEESNLEDAQGGRKAELGNMEPQLVPLGAVVLGNESIAPVGQKICPEWHVGFLCVPHKSTTDWVTSNYTHQFSTVREARDLDSPSPGSG